MPIPPQAIAAAQAVQQQAAHDPSQRVRLIAGPGTGKSSSIEQRVGWLIGQGANAERIFAVSFTRSSARDLGERILAYCASQGHEQEASEVKVSTLHSLALRTLRLAGLLNQYPADPLVLDDWELENIFDAEFGRSSGIASKERRAAIRSFHEAIWNTGVQNPPNYIPPNPPISAQEQHHFNAFHGPRTQAYSCVLPGEIIRQCVEAMQAGNLNPVELLGMDHLIVDEYQDLSPMDQNFIDLLVGFGASIFIAGDDDQSIYSFRYASPQGIQSFPTRHPGATTHTLQECFRCMPNIMAAATTLIGSHAAPQRVPKTMQSLYRHAAPQSNGLVHRWRYATGYDEARSIAESCASLCQAGVNPRDILILLCNRPTLLPEIAGALSEANVPFAAAEERFLDSKAGRLVHSLLRIVTNETDHVAHRVLLGLRSGVGVARTHEVCEAVIQNNLNFRDIFYVVPLPPNVFSARAITALGHARTVCAQIMNWDADDSVAQRTADLSQIVTAAIGVDEALIWQQFAATIPPEASLRELRDLIAAEDGEHRARIMARVFERLEQELPPEQQMPDQIRIMTMHGAKGLSGKIVFIPGLEEPLIPGGWRAQFPGLVLEAARLLYVSITRARAVCFLSYAGRRFRNGQMQTHAPSRFANHTGGAFVSRAAPLTPPEVQVVIDECAKI